MLDDEDEEVDIVGVSNDSAPASSTLSVPIPIVGNKQNMYVCCAVIPHPCSSDR